MASGSRTPLILTLCEGQWALFGYPSLLWRTRCSGTPTPFRHHPAAEYTAVCGCSVAAGRVTWDRYRPGVYAAVKGTVVNPGSAPAARRCWAAWRRLLVGVKQARHGSLSGPGWVLGEALSLAAVPRVRA